MPRLIDGDNLLGTWPGRGRTDDDKRALVREVDALRRRERKRIVIVFDGTAPPGVSHGADVLYSGRGASADSMILALLKGEREPRGWTVVTNDRQLADRCRHLGARIEGPRPFRERLAAGEPGEKPDPAGELDFWLKEFGGDDPPRRR